MRQAIFFVVVSLFTASALEANQREPFGAYYGIGFSDFVSGPDNSTQSDVQEFSFYVGRNFSSGHVEFHVDYLTFDSSTGEDAAYRLQLAYSAERISETEIAFYLARTYDGNVGTDVTEYGLTSNTILADERTELYLSGGIYDEFGDYSLGLSAAVDYRVTDDFVAEFAIGAYDGDAAAELLFQYEVPNSPVRIFTSALADNDGDFAARIGVSLAFGVDRQKFRPRVTPLELGVLF